ncbi:hypothetical protein [Actinacidiphila yeochonensis]|uniref:hypothetical protein n=1 Tax=Actinacidiphila yeochonensis TaxID=89050 RepID=UPI000564BD7C|nr:hypothetical protein [Actinacidiphila yeochonensis]
MSTNHYYGDNVNMYGGQNNVGMIKNQTVPAAPESAELRAVVQELLHLVRELRAQVPPFSVRTIDEALPVITADATVPAQERHRALMAVAGIAATVGAVGLPVVDAVNRILELL